jgi:hypothetical protein
MVLPLTMLSLAMMPMFVLRMMLPLTMLWGPTLMLSSRLPATLLLLTVPPGRR